MLLIKIFEEGDLIFIMAEKNKSELGNLNEIKLFLKLQF